MSADQESLSVAEAGYEVAEAGFLSLVRSRANRTDLAKSSDNVATAAERWNIAAYQVFHAAPDADRQDFDWLTERTEVLSELWADIAAAYRV